MSQSGITKYFAIKPVAETETIEPRDNDSDEGNGVGSTAAATDRPH